MPKESQNDADRVEAAERAQELLDEGRHDLRQLDRRFLGFLATYFEDRLRVVGEKIVPAKQILELPAYSEGQHHAVIRDAIYAGQSLGLPEELVLSITGAVLVLSVDAQLPVLGGNGVPTTAALHRVE